MHFSIEMCFSFGCDPPDLFDTETDPPKDRPIETVEQPTVRRTERPSIVSTVNLSLESFTEWDASGTEVIMFLFTDRIKGLLKNIVPFVPQT